MLDSKSELGQKVLSLAHELQTIVEENFLKDPQLTDKAIMRAREIRDEIQGFGLAITFTAKLNLRNLKFEAKVEIWQPKDDMTVEQAALYDEWFTRVNGLEGVS